MTDIYETIADRIVKGQEYIIGPVAVDQAKKVSGIRVNSQNHIIGLEGNKKNILEQLVKQYEKLFGRTSVEVCKEAIKDIDIPKSQLPHVLQ